MKWGIIAVCLCAFFFLVPLQCYTIGNDLGVGIQGAMYRFQMTPQGNSLIPLTSELGYVINGTYAGKTVFSVIFWILGTLLLSGSTMISLVQGNRLTLRHFRIICAGLAGAAVMYLVSCIFQYGLFFSGPAGSSLPTGVILMVVVAVGLYSYQDFFKGESRERTGLNK
jgi:hypothetical protein